MENDNAPMKQQLLVSAYRVRHGTRCGGAVDARNPRGTARSPAHSVCTNRPAHEEREHVLRQALVSVSSSASEWEAEQQLELCIALEARLDVLRGVSWS